MLNARTWPVFAFLGSAGLLAGAHGFETFGHLAPCEMCLQQRQVHWVIAGMALGGFAIVRLRPSLARTMAILLGAGFLVSVYFAGMHVAVEHHWITAQCDAAKPGDSLAFDVNAPLVAPRCDVPAWSMFGVTMAGYNALVSLLFALASFALALTPKRNAGG